jgi:SDR family mycofactocin-dependent oxidoreductase
VAGRVEGKVAFVTGAARGQGRSHALTLAREGADIIAVDICRQMDTVPYPMATADDLAETERLVKELGRNVHAVQADVRERRELREAVDAGVDVLGRLDVVVANAGILPFAMGEPDPMDLVDVIDVNMIGVMNTVAVSIPHLGAGGSVIVTGSLAAKMPKTFDNPTMGPGGAGYGWTKTTIPTLVEQYAVALAPLSIRVNTVHPFNCNTDLLHNVGIYAVFRPDVQNPTLDDVMPAFEHLTAMPVPYIEPEDISNVVLFLASDESRFMTGEELSVDAGTYIKMGGAH